MKSVYQRHKSFFPNSDKPTDMADAYLANYNMAWINYAEFTVKSYKRKTGMNLPHLYLVTTKAKRGEYLYLMYSFTNVSREDAT